MGAEILRILLIEHDAGFARYVGEMLEQTRNLSAQMVCAQSLGAGLAFLLQDTCFDVVIVDLAVPDGAGIGNLLLIRAQEKDVPVIVAGDSDDEIIALQTMQAGAQEYLTKSQLTPGWLERSIRYAIERNRMDLALLAAEKKYHSLFDNLVEGIFQTTSEGRYILANAALARIYGYATGDELIASMTDIGRRLYVQEGRRDEFKRLMQEHDILTGFESQVHRKDGSIIWISENCRAIRNAQGELLYYEGTVEDISQRIQAEEDLRNSEALYHSLVETLPQNIFRKDVNGRFTFANQQFCRLLGKPLSEILGKTDFDFYPPQMAEKFQADDRKTLEGGKTLTTEEENIQPGGVKRFVKVVKTPLIGADGKPLGMQGIFWDITDEKLADEKIKRINSLLAQNRKELRIKNIQMEDDLKMAREIQLTMLPQQYPVFPRSASTRDTAIQFTHRYRPTGTVGGDFFTISALSEDEASVFICDVAGHGVRSSLVTAMVRALLEELKPVATNPGQFLTKLNSDLYSILKHTGTPMLTTAFYLVVDWRTGLTRYSNAGHPKPLHVARRSGKVAPMTNSSGAGQPALGLFEDAQYDTSSLQLSRSDLVMLFTDGLYEVQDSQEELYTQALLIQGVERRMQLEAPQMFDELLQEIHLFSDGTGFSDDVCLVGVDYRGPTESPTRLKI